LSTSSQTFERYEQREFSDEDFVNSPVLISASIITDASIQNLKETVNISFSVSYETSHTILSDTLPGQLKHKLVQGSEICWPCYDEYIEVSSLLSLYIRHSKKD